MYSRRETMVWMAAGLACAASAAGAQAPVPSKRGEISYGAAVRPSLLTKDPDYARAIAANCDMLVAEGGMLWADIRPTRDVFHFDEADAAVAFASAHNMQMRGHTLAWYGAMPAWTEAISTALEAEAELTDHIARVMTRYRGAIQSWNVVNEPLVDDPSGPNDLRPSIWSRRLGPAYLAVALRAAHAADPAARLVVNEYDIEFVGPRFQRKRAAFVALIRGLVESGAPLHGVGVQGHLKGDLSIDRAGLADFAAEMKKLSLDVLVTELDVIDNKLPADVNARDLMVAEQARQFLSAICEGAPLSAILTWGISDKYTWVPMYYRRKDGLPNRPLPLDQVYAAKPFMSVISQFRLRV